MEQAGDGTGEQVLDPAAGARQFRALVGAAPALPARNRHPGGGGAPPRDTTIPCQELADCRKYPGKKARPAAVRRTPRQSAERRAGPRHGPVIFGDPKIGPLARRTIGCGVPHQRLSAPCSPHFIGSRKQTRGTRRPVQTGRRSLAI